MATTAQIKKFIAEIAPLAQKAYKTLGKVKPSICIGMACVECAYGTAESCKHHSYLGQKVGTGRTAKKYWDGTFFTSKTSEEYTVGNHTIINAAFRSYKSMEQCVFNYYELLNTSLYSRVKASANYTTQMQQIKLCKYMTSSTEVNSVLTIIKRYNLTQYDGEISTSSSVPSSTLKKGSSGSGVVWLQTALKNLGYEITIDGIFGTKTETVVKKFQEEAKLKVDGVVGTQTRGLILQLI